MVNVKIVIPRSVVNLKFLLHKSKKSLKDLLDPFQAQQKLGQQYWSSDLQPSQYSSGLGWSSANIYQSVV